MAGRSVAWGLRHRLTMEGTKRSILVLMIFHKHQIRTLYQLPLLVRFCVRPAHQRLRAKNNLPSLCFLLRRDRFKTSGMEIAVDYRGLEESLLLCRDRFDTCGMGGRRQIACSRRKEMCLRFKTCGMEIVEKLRGLDECSLFGVIGLKPAAWRGICILRLIFV